MIFAVYGTLKKGQYNHRLLDVPTVKFLGTFETKPEYTMYSLGAFPAIKRIGKTPISVELYETNDTVVIANLYRLEGYRGKDENNFYNLDKVETPFGEASLFTLGNRVEIKDLTVITNGIWK